MNADDTARRPDDSANGDRTCPVCGEDEVRSFNHRDTFEYGSGESAVTLQVDLPVRRCAACDFEFLDQEGERLRHEAVCRHLGVLTSAEVLAIRRQYGMTRSAFAQLSGLGEATLNRWENGVVVQNPANDRYLRLLAMPDVIRRLEDLLAHPHMALQEPASDQRARFRILTVSEVQRRRQDRFQLRKAS